MRTLYQVYFINGRVVEFFAERLTIEDGVCNFMVEDEVVGEFKLDNIAGYLSVAEEEDA